MYTVADACPALGKQLYYNETKRKAGMAECLYAANFLKDAEQLSPEEIREHFDHRTSLGARVIWNGFRAFLEFHPSEHPDNPTLIDIARDYMRRLGFGEQPYLVYLHRDTAITHLHILSTTILPNGKSINTDQIGRLRSAPIRKELEKEYGLLPVSNSRVPIPRKNPAEQVRYGEFPNWQAIGDTLKYVLDTFQFRSLSELNAVLKLYNLTALTGRPGSRLHSFRGLLYQILDEKGKNRGVPIKASALPFKPTLARLEQRFAAARLDLERAVRTRLVLDEAIRDKTSDAARFADVLRRGQLEAAPVFAKDGSVAELHFVDLAAKIVVGPADLGQEYTAAAIRNRLGFDPFVRDLQTQVQTAKKAQSEDQSLSLDRARKCGRHR